MQFTPSNGRWPSPFNEVANLPRLDGRVIRVADCTLRDGEQQAGIVLDRAAKVEIAKALEAIGVYEIEAGTIASSEEDREAIAAICALGLSAKISVLCRGLEADIDMAAEIGVWGVRLSFPISDIEREYKLKGISQEDYLARTRALVEYANAKGLAVVFSPFDTTRANLPFLRRVAAGLGQLDGVDRLRIVDTTGCALPEAIAFIVENVKEAAPGLAMEIHCHNDFGLSCANTLAGVMAGADYVSTTINGIGERCGNASTEEVVMALEVLCGYDTGIKLDGLKSISELVERHSGIAVHANKAVVGYNAFRHEAGMVVAGVLKNPYTAEAYDPAIVGQSRDILLGKKSGLVSVKYKAAQLGISVTDQQMAVVLHQVKEEAVRLRRALNDEEFAKLARAAAERR
ncbi:homocitrate synthase/isopropylmalate synthase family protein [Mesorhizobium sp. 1B3]|uniref:homocitrate synthase/isopropylmalate synthase family protein n=1 Tax=Mesorhizobium sp. 1B3 TaxID=3243599 RepID=UPI003D953C0D